MSQQAKVTNLVSKLRFKLSDRRNLKNPDGPVGRHNKIRKTVTALFKYERIELNYHRGDECRGYAERLISEAIRYGDCHKPTMDVANYWLLEKQLVHKLFKVLAPRYQNYKSSYTKMWKAPGLYPGHGLPRCVLELRGNIYPPLGEDKSYNKNLIHNVLLSEAKKEFENKKVEKLLQGKDGGTEKSPDAVLDSNVKSNETSEENEQKVKADDNVSKKTEENKSESVSLGLDVNKMSITDTKGEETTTTTTTTTNKEKEV